MEPTPPPAAAGEKGSGAKGGKKSGGGSGAARPTPPADAGRTAKSRDRYLASLLLDAADDGRAEFLAVSERDGIDASVAALPPECPPRIRTAIRDARQLLALGKWPEALAAATATLALDGRFVTPRLIAASALEAQGRSENALSQQLDPAVDAAASDTPALLVRTAVKWATENLDGARADLVRAVTLRPADGRLLLALGALEFERKSYADAAALLLRATDERADDAVAWRALARAMYFGEDWTGAVAALERVVRIVEGPPPPPGAPVPPNRPVALDAHLGLSILYADRVSDRDKAKAHASAFLQGGGVDLPLDAWMKALVAK